MSEQQSDLPMEGSDTPRQRPTLQDAINEIDRELALREQVYPKLITANKLKREKAEKQYLALKAAKHYLLQLQSTKQPPRAA